MYRALIVLLRGYYTLIEDNDKVWYSRGIDIKKEYIINARQYKNPIMYIFL